MNRINIIAGHLNQSTNKHPNDVVICSALRTPITKANKGLFKDTAPELLLAAVLKAIR